MEITSYRGHSTRNGIYSALIGLLMFLVSYYSAESVLTKRVLFLMAVAFCLIGFLILVWSPKRVVHFDSTKKSIRISDQSRFGASEKIFLYRDIQDVSLKEWVDPDPENFPVKIIFYWVVLRTVRGEEINLTERTKDKDEALNVLDRITRKMAF